ncbi:hypothetical protein [Sphingobium sp. CFD-1]|uniref:hypothetical protein n=1 Tax=Sphingobium sp. CFD-1 TaxID=2878545 RepID=UPI00214BA1C4|nr:hypothetical protein [Sphingobium sp. CFD-1]
MSQPEARTAALTDTAKVVLAPLISQPSSVDPDAPFAVARSAQSAAVLTHQDAHDRSIEPTPAGNVRAW